MRRSITFCAVLLLGCSALISLPGCCSTEAALATTHAENAKEVEVLTLDLLDRVPTKTTPEGEGLTEGEKKAAKALVTTNTRGAEQLAKALNK